MNVLIRVRRGFFPIFYRRCIHNMRLTETIDPRFHKTPLEPKSLAIIKENSSDILYSSYAETNILPLPFYTKGNMIKKINKEKDSVPSTGSRSVFAQFLEKENIDDHPIETSTVETTDDTEESSAIVHDDAEDIATREALAAARKQIMRDMGFRTSVLENEDESFDDNWMKDYETFNEADVSYDSHYGTPDPTEPITKVPCHGCGSNLHCQDTSVPGYLPSEIIKGQPQHVLKTMVCQRCHFLKHYNTSLKINVDPEEYVKMLSNIDEKALVVLLVDLTELPFSIWPNIVDVLGPSRPIFIVGNKIDLLPQDSPHYLEHIKNTLENTLVNTGLTRANIKYISLISAKTNFGIEDMITNLYKFWRNNGDVYLVGNGNAGKSTLFNALLGSDYCKIRARNLIRRATASLLPGTTLRMLKFPISKPSGALIHERNRRTQNQRRHIFALRKLNRDQVNTGRAPERTLMGHLDQTFLAPRESLNETALHLTDEPDIEQTFNEKSKTYRSSHWFYDTPGVLRNDQIITQLTNEELLYTIPHQALWPRNFHVRPGETLFLSGLGRIDFISGTNNIRLAVFASEKLSILITTTDKADELYEKCFGTEILNVPRGDAERLKRFPKLVKCEKKIAISNYSELTKRSAGDIVLSSAGWVSVFLRPTETAYFNAWTPNANGMFVRKTPILPFAGELYRGDRIKFTPAYEQKEPKASAWITTYDK